VNPTGGSHPSGRRGRVGLEEAGCGAGPGLLGRKGEKEGVLGRGPVRGRDGGVGRGELGSGVPLSLFLSFSIPFIPFPFSYLGFYLFPLHSSKIIGAKIM